jgi:hypothetical protein
MRNFGESEEAARMALEQIEEERQPMFIPEVE